MITYKIKKGGVLIAQDGESATLVVLGGPNGEEITIRISQCDAEWISAALNPA